ncbi:MAG: hypothetical protein JWN63_2576 [Candidatus Acidoferrum typicum]|nr:hypothetical protein [Candidatus Acidoferrum typicum]
MFKLTEAADIEKAGRSIGNFFAKRLVELEDDHAFHDALAAHHQGIAQAHATHAAKLKTQIDAMKAMVAEWAA